MKKILLVSLLIISCFSLEAQELVWNNNIDQAIEISNKTNKPLMLFFTGSDWDAVKVNFGFAPMIFGTLVSSIVALALATPLAIGVAIFLSEFAPAWLLPAITQEKESGTSWRIDGRAAADARSNRFPRGHLVSVLPGFVELLELGDGRWPSRNGPGRAAEAGA